MRFSKPSACGSTGSNRFHRSAMMWMCTTATRSEKWEASWATKQPWWTKGFKTNRISSHCGSYRRPSMNFSTKSIGTMSRCRACWMSLRVTQRFATAVSGGTWSTNSSQNVWSAKRTQRKATQKKPRIPKMASTRSRNPDGAISTTGVRSSCTRQRRS